MKIMVCGKGGSGKSTLAALLALNMDKAGKRVLLADVDESNIGLYRMLGLSMPQPLMDSLGGKKGFAEKTRAAGIGLDGSSGLFPKALRIDQLPAECVAKVSSIHLLSVGKIHHFGEGCACPMGKLFRMLFSSLTLEENDCVIVDTTAGVEHFGRRLDDQCDHILCVVDPSFESIAMAKKVSSFAKEMNLPVSFVLNKITPAVEADLTEALEGLPVIGRLPENKSLFLNTLKGTPLDPDMDGVEEIRNALVS